MPAMSRGLTFHAQSWFDLSEDLYANRAQLHGGTPNFAHCLEQRISDYHVQPGGTLNLKDMADRRRALS